MTLVLICNQRRNVGFDATGTKANNHDSCHIATERMSMGERGRESGGPQNEQAHPVNGAKADNSLVAAEVLISDDGAENWRDCAKSC